MSTRHQMPIVTVICVFVLAIDGRVGVAFANGPPVAETGLQRYAANVPVQLDGSGSYDPDSSGPLSYAWTQVSGPPLIVTGANTVAPVISGFVQTKDIQECLFELVVNDGQSASLPDRVKVVIVPDFGPTSLRLENTSFDPDKPTFVYFGGGDCVNGYSGQPWSGGPAWTDAANIIGFPDGYAPDSGAGTPTYYKYGDMIITYLSTVAPNYWQPIQTAGHSTGGQPAIDVAIRLNTTYGDARYAVNRVTFLDATAYCRASYQASIDMVLACDVEGELCWIDNYVGTLSGASGKNDVLNIWFDQGNNTSLASTERHRLPRNWYRGSPALEDANRFSQGAVAGAYWSVIGPGKNLQLASTPNSKTYHFTWYGDTASGHMDLYDPTNWPARLPEPVTLASWVNVVDSSGHVDGAVLSCHESENAVGYELLFGSAPCPLMAFHVVSDTPLPPTAVIRDFLPGETWWTIRVRDQHGSTIYADPVHLDLMSLPPLPVENSRTGKRYGLIGHAIQEAAPGDTIRLEPQTYEENITVSVPLTVTSADPNDPVTVMCTMLRGRDADPTVIFSGAESAGSTLAGLTIQSETVGISCRDAAPTIRNCVVESPEGIAVEFWHNLRPEIIDCTFVGQVKEGGDPGLVAYWRLDETEGMVASDSEGENDATVMGVPLWRPEGGMMGGALELSGDSNLVVAPFVRNPSEGPLSVFAWIKGGAPGQVVVSQGGGADWLSTDADGALITELKSAGRTARTLTSTAVITDGNWHRIGLTWDGANRTLYTDDVKVATDTQTKLAGSTGDLLLGVSAKAAPGTFWQGLIDDVRVYDRAVEP
ncbi:MAG: hypothetical protein KBE65_19710 [Phycisphaerae bacterium]|nr:hypothetical protein [Phycisphaerae bacterium]